MSTPAPTNRPNPTPTTPPKNNSMVWFWVILLVLLFILGYMWYTETPDENNFIKKSVSKIGDALNLKRRAPDYE
jgi:hypothetical protein